MVGLPARGKTYTARKLARYMSWLGYHTRVFNVGNYRRERFGARVAHDFFDPSNPTGMNARKTAALAALDDLKTWFDEGGQIGIYDATNSTKSRRKMVHQALRNNNIEVLFLETVCNDPDVIEANIRESKLSNPDYIGMEPEQAVQDFRARIAHYEQAYEPLDDASLSFIRVSDVSRRVELNRISGFRMGRIVNFVMNLHITPRTIWLTRHGESMANVAGTLGGDPDLSERGKRYAIALSEFVNLHSSEDHLSVWTSTLQRTIQTAKPLNRHCIELRALDEIDAGICDGLTYSQVAEQYPEEFAARTADKLRYRYPRGESYEDVIDRLDPLIIELERQQETVLVVAHQAVLRALYGYFAGRSRSEVPHIDMPLHTIIALTPKAYGCNERRFVLAPSST